MCFNINLETSGNWIFLQILFICFLNPFAAFSQAMLDVKTEPEPYTILYDKMNPEYPVKSKISYSEYRKENGNRKDTLRMEVFDKKGELMKTVSYHNGRRTEATLYQRGKNFMEWWQDQSKGDKVSKYISRTNYTSFGKFASFNNATITNGDTVSTGKAKFTYNAERQLIRREDYTSGQMLIFRTFEYKKQNMIRAYIQVVNSVGTRYEYEYNDKNQPVAKKVSLVRNGQPEVFEYNYYEYVGEQLISERFSDSQRPGVDVNAKYSYGPAGRLTDIKIQQDTLYRDIHYEYSQSKLKKISVKTNTWGGFNKFLLFIYTNPLLKAPIAYETEFFYDIRDNLVQIKELVNGELQSDRRYILEYY